ncbi:MAG TPA: hypothetical protein VG406_29825 [Isosphaeraceae bacterium]|nr:hypothetical protein [Isosphaeraceae bacterium]
MAITGRRVVRVLPWALVVGLAATFGPRPAGAMGCHAPERPVASLAFLIDSRPDGARVVLTALPERPDSRVAPRPCEDDMPRAPSRTVAPQSSPGVLAVLLRPTTPEVGRIAPSSTRATPREGSSRIDRPPRPAAPAVGS